MANLSSSLLEYMKLHSLPIDENDNTLYRIIKYFFIMEVEGHENSLDFAKTEQRVDDIKTKFKKKNKHQHKKGQVSEAYELFVETLKSRIKREHVKFAIPSRSTFERWISGRGAPRNFPGIDDLQKLLQWAREWDGPERKLAGRAIGGMSEEEMSQKHQKRDYAGYSKSVPDEDEEEIEDMFHEFQR